MATTLHRPVCALLGCAYPIVLAGMGGVARSELVAALTEATEGHLRTMTKDIPGTLLTDRHNVLRFIRSRGADASGGRAMLVGYARTSTVTQDAGLEAQERDLKAIGVEKLFTEQVSSVAERAQLEAALDFCRARDALVVTRLDRLARSIRDLCAIVDRLEAKGVSLRILGMGLDTATTNGRLTLNVLGSVAQFEREVMLERQREGIAKAKSEGKFKGRAPTARRKAEEVRAMATAGMTRQVIAGKLGMSERSVYRVLAG
jgi:DNA invertase Pin-like site-specific DNA recombinase